MRQRRKDYAALRMSAVLAMHWSVRRKKTHVCVKRLMFAYERAFSAKYWSEWQYTLKLSAPASNETTLKQPASNVTSLNQIRLAGFFSSRIVGFFPIPIPANPYQQTHNVLIWLYQLRPFHSRGGTRKKNGLVRRSYSKISVLRKTLAAFHALVKKWTSKST